MSHLKLVNGVMVSITPEEIEAEELANFPDRKQMKIKEITAERDRRVYSPIAAVDIKGDNSVMVEPDIRNDTDKANLLALSLHATQLKAAGETGAVIPFGAADNVQHMLTPAEMIAVAAAPFPRASALFVRARQLKDAANAATDNAALDLIDIETGSINGDGGWPK